MSRSLRLEFAGGVYHVTSCGDRREDIYLDDQDRLLWPDIFGLVCKRFNWNSPSTSVPAIRGIDPLPP